VEEIIGVAQVTDHVFIGSARALFAASELREAGVSHVLKLFFDDSRWPTEFIVLEHPLEDGVFIPKEALDHGVSFVRNAVESGHRVLVMCGLGASRSSTIVLAYLIEQGYDLRDAFRLLRSARPQAWPARALWTTLITHYDVAYDLDQIEEWA